MAKIHHLNHGNQWYLRDEALAPEVRNFFQIEFRTKIYVK